MANSFTGTFSTPAKEAEFMAITTSVADLQFYNERFLTSISLPEVTTIGKQAFYNLKLTGLSLPKAISIGDNAFFNSPLTTLDLPEATTIGEASFNYSRLINLSLPEATTIGGSAFSHSPLASLSIPKVTSIGANAFRASLLTSLSLPKVQTIGQYAFYDVHLTSISLPEATTIGEWAFRNIVNAATTTVTLPSKFYTSAEKDRIFHSGNWNHITFLEKPTKSFIELGDKWITKPFLARPGKKLIGITPGGTNTPIVKINSLKLDFSYNKSHHNSFSMAVYVNGVSVGGIFQNNTPLAKWTPVNLTHSFTYLGQQFFITFSSSVWIYDNSSLTEAGFYVNETNIGIGGAGSAKDSLRIFENNGNSGHWVGEKNGVYELTPAQKTWAEKTFNKYVPGKKLILKAGA